MQKLHIHMNFKKFFIEVSEFEMSQMGQPKGKYPYVSKDEYEKLRPHLVAKSQNRATKNKVDFDPSMTAYTPGETLQLLKHPKVQSWFNKMRNFKIPENYGTVILVPCAATKPWGFSCKSDFYKGYNKIRQQVINGEIEPVYFVSISEPLGVVPEEFWGDDPSKLFPQYDNPGLFKDTVLQTGMLTKDWSKSPIGKKREMPFDDLAANQAIEILGTEIGNFIKNNKQHRFVSFVENPDKTSSTHSRMLNIAERVAGIPIARNLKKPKVGREKNTIEKHIKKTIFENTENHEFTPAILNFMNKKLKSQGYDVRGSEDLKSRLNLGHVYRNGTFLNPDWQKAYEAALVSVNKTRETRQRKKDLTPHVNRKTLAELGFTNNPIQAGYIDPQGNLINLSGGSSYSRGHDHRIIGGTAGMQELMAHDGYIRYMPESGGLDLKKKPTSAQEQTMQRLINYHRGHIYLDLQDGLGEFDDRYRLYFESSRRWSFEFPEGTKPSRINTAITQFFSGITPVITIRDQF